MNNPISNSVHRPSLVEIFHPDFYKKDNWFEEFCEGLFKITSRRTTIKAEVYFGFLHFVSCSYCLVVVPNQLKSAHYDQSSTFLSTAVVSGIGV